MDILQENGSFVQVATKHRISIWLVDRWNVDVARNSRTGKPMKRHVCTTNKVNFGSFAKFSTFDSGHVFFETESQYLNHPDLNVGEKTNAGRKKISQFDDYVTGKPLCDNSVISVHRSKILFYIRLQSPCEPQNLC